MDILKKLSKEFNVQEHHVANVVGLLDTDNTIPFISRYRKEQTGSMDDQVLRELADRLMYLRNLEKRKEEVLKSIEEQGKLTDEIVVALAAAEILTEVEDIYRPYKPKRKTRASVAREKGLEPLADVLFAQNVFTGTLDELAVSFIDPEKGVLTVEEALQGAKDIIAESISDNAVYRKHIRAVTADKGVVGCARICDDDEKSKVYQMYFDYSEPVSKIPPHRILAMTRAEKEEVIKVTLEIDAEIINTYLLHKAIVDKNSVTSSLVEDAVRDAYSRLIEPSIEREIRTFMFDDASEKGIELFAKNLKSLLLTAPLKGKCVMGFDPGFRTGCKLCVVDPTGKVLDTSVIYPTKPQERTAESEKTVFELIKKYKVDVIAIGNGTASKESEIFVSNLLKKIKGCTTKYIIVSESGASVYSASKLAAEEFPNYDVTLRSAVSIARRLQDPLAEFVKIDPKAIGVGQYQHDMKQARLNEALGGVVEDCVNAVGVDLNTASFSLLSYVSGVNGTAAKNIVAFREENGAFTSRSQVKKVPKIGPKAFEQCAGFLRIPGGKEILDNTGIHPESYAATKKLLEMFELTLADVKTGNLKDLGTAVKAKGAKAVADSLGIGVPTLHDIVKELERPGRDLRDDFDQPILNTEVLELKDLKEGMKVKGIVRNVIDFGAFVDIGVHQDGLIHISQISDRYIKHPSEVLSVGDVVEATVMSVDVNRNRIGLTLKNS